MIQDLPLAPSISPPAVEAHRLGWHVDQRWVLRELSFQVAGGSLVGVAGPNGAGKSALLRLLASLAAPSEGWIRVAERDVARETGAVRRSVGYLSERAGLYARLTVRQNLEFVARAHGMSKAVRAEVVDTLLEVVGLTRQADTLVDLLSPGLRRRAALAAALVHDPPVLLLDDPLRGLDGVARLEQTEVLRELRGMGKTIVLAGNLLADLAELCDELLVLRDGQLAWRGAAADIPTDDQEDVQARGISGFDRMLARVLER